MRRLIRWLLGRRPAPVRVVVRCDDIDRALWVSLIAGNQAVDWSGW